MVRSRGIFKVWVSIGTAAAIILSASSSDAGSLLPNHDEVTTPVVVDDDREGPLPEPSSAPVAEDPSVPDFIDIGDTKPAFGKKTGFQLKLGPDALDSGVLSELFAQLSGQDFPLLEAAARTTNLLDGEVALTVAGLRVWNDKSEFKNGMYTYTAGIPTTYSRLKVVTVPVGPVLVQVDAGLAYALNLEAALAPQISLPIESTTLKASLATQAEVAGFLEGYAQFLFVRGGLGAQIDILKGRAALDATLGLNAQTRKITYSGFLETLSGKFYAFADTFSMLRMRWKRIWQPTIKDWKGFCVQLNKNETDPEAVCPR
jgi:hypothetical protein